MIKIEDLNFFDVHSINKEDDLKIVIHFIKNVTSTYFYDTKEERDREYLIVKTSHDVFWGLFKNER